MTHRKVIALSFLVAHFWIPTHGAAERVLHDNAIFYRERLDRIVRDFIDSGTLPTSKELERVRAFENHFLSIAEIDPNLRDRIPPLLLLRIDPRNGGNIPAQWIVARAAHGGLDLRSDGLRSRQFRVLSHMHEIARRFRDAPGRYQGRNSSSGK